MLRYLLLIPPTDPPTDPPTEVDHAEVGSRGVNPLRAGCGGWRAPGGENGSPARKMLSGEDRDTPAEDVKTDLAVSVGGPDPRCLSQARPDRPLPPRAMEMRPVPDPAPGKPQLGDPASE